MKAHKKLGELASTAICGNDISSSVLYVSALAISFAGQYAWITLLIVALVLFSFRKIYGEVVGALPLNGGAYNALLNTTSKSMASLAACLTLLSYMATAVISANEAMHYLHHLIPSIPIIICTIALLAIFAGLTIMGITESAKVAIGIFIFHLVSMSVLMIFIALQVMQIGFGEFINNWQSPLTSGSIGMAIFFGFAASMLGISGFESSSNFVEEQKDGVFPKTLRNMWIVVSIMNPLMAFLAISMLPIPEIKNNSAALLSHLGEVSSGRWLASVVSIDAVLVLSGAVLTSFVGVSGLLERITLDRVMPNYFLKKNKKGSSYRIIILFFILSVSVLLITKGNVTLLAGVYALSFLSVMTLFVIGNMLLKVKRRKLPRPERAKWAGLLFALTAVSIALIGNVLIVPNPGQPRNVVVFLQYFIPSLLFLMVMLNRTAILKLLFNIIQYLFSPIHQFIDKNNVGTFLRRGVYVINKGLIRMINEINQQEFVFFTKGDNVANLNKVMLYLKKNEHTRRIRIVNVLRDGEKTPENLLVDIDVLDRAYPDIHIDYIQLEGRKFGPELIAELSEEWNIPINFMFIGSPGDNFPYRIQELGGVRLII